MTSKKEILIVVVAAILIGGGVKLFSGSAPKTPVAAMDEYFMSEDTTLTVDQPKSLILVHGGSPTTKDTATWHYLWNIGVPPTYPRGWNQVGFDPEAAGWSSAQANFGLIEAGTPVPALEPINNEVSVQTPMELYRTTFDVVGLDASQIRFVHVRYARNDGIIIYLNGQAIVAQNMDYTLDEIRRDPILVSAGYLVSTDGGAVTVFRDAVIDLQQFGIRLQPTGNVVAAQVHQDLAAGPTSSDRAFDLSLDVPGGLLFNDSDESDGATLSIASTSDPVNSDGKDIQGDELTVNSDGTFTYKPAPNYSGVVTFEYVLQSTEAGFMGRTSVEKSRPVSVTIVVNEMGSSALNDAYTVQEGRTLEPTYPVDPRFAPVIESGTLSFLRNEYTPGLGAEWRFLPVSNGTNSPGEDYPAGWTSPDFDDSSWASGRAPFAGVGEGSTPVMGFIESLGNRVTPMPFHRSDPTGLTSHTTYLFRTTAVVPVSASSLTIGRLIDDGAIFYLNGVEILRYNVELAPDDSRESVSGIFPPPTPTDFALRNVAPQNLIETDYNYSTVDLSMFPPGLLRVGEPNVFAVEIHMARFGDDQPAAQLESTRSGRGVRGGRRGPRAGGARGRGVGRIAGGGPGGAQPDTRGVRRGQDGTPLPEGTTARRGSRRGPAALSPEERAELEAQSKGDDDAGFDISVTPGGPNDFGVLDNDIVEGAHGRVLVELVTGPQNALSFDLRSDGTFSYTPNEGFVGTDSFEYKFLSGNPPEMSNVASVQIEVAAKFQPISNTEPE